MEKLNTVHFMGVRKAVTVDTGSETIVEQCHAETTNINKIMARAKAAGGLPPNHKEPRYLDVSAIGELLDVKLAMTEMQESYDALPEVIKEKLPFADIGNVTDETLQEMFSELNEKNVQAGTQSASKVSGEGSQVQQSQENVDDKAAGSQVADASKNSDSQS